MNGSQEAKPPSLGEFIGAAAFLLGLFSAWLYAAGWAYAYHYFDRFGIPFALDAGQSLISAPVIKTLLALLRLKQNDWPFRRLISTLSMESMKR